MWYICFSGLAKRVGAKILIASTSEVYGDPEVHPQPETYWGHVNPIGTTSEFFCYYYEALTILNVYSHIQARELVMMKENAFLKHLATRMPNKKMYLCE